MNGYVSARRESTSEPLVQKTAIYIGRATDISAHPENVMHLRHAPRLCADRARSRQDRIPARRFFDRRAFCSSSRGKGAATHWHGLALTRQVLALSASGGVP
jgi:hypothetical protein